MGLTIAEVAAYTGLTPHTLRYYERADLMIHTVERTTSGHRSYSTAALDAIVLITRLRATGMPIRDVRAYVRMCREGSGNEAARLALLKTHRERMTGQLRELNEHMRAVDYKISLYDRSLPDPGSVPPSGSGLTSSALEELESPS